MKIKKTKPASVTAKAEDWCAGVDGHPALFPNPSPTTSSVRAQVGVVSTAEALVRSRAPGAAKARNVQLAVLIGMLENGLNYVQGCADKCSTPEDAAACIEAARLSVALVGGRFKPILAATQATPGGAVSLVANAKAMGVRGRRKTCFNWQYTSDGKIFVSLPSTPKAKTSLANLTPLATYGFRVSVTHSDGVMGEWSQLVNFLVH